MRGPCAASSTEGARVVIADIQDAKGHTLADTLGGAAVYQHVDVATEDEVKAAVKRAVDEFGRLDCMFNNAGFGGAIGPIETTPVEDYDRTMNVLLRGVFLGMKHAAPVMKAQGSGQHHQHGERRRAWRRARAAHLQRGEGGRHQPDALGGAGAGRERRARQLHLPGRHRDAAVWRRGSAAAKMPSRWCRTALANFQPIKRGGVPDDIAQRGAVAGER